MVTQSVSLSSAGYAADDVDLIGLAYEAAVDPTLFPTILRRLTEIAGAEIAIWLGAQYHQRTSIDLHYVGLSDAGMGDYARVRWTSPLSNAMSSLAPCVAAPDRSLVPRPVLERSRLYEEWIHPNHLADGLMAALAPLDQDTVILTLIRERGRVARPFADDDSLRRYQRLLPHIGRAASLRLKLARAAPMPAGLTAAALNRLTIATLLIDDAGALVWANTPAERLLRQSDGLTYTARRDFAAATSEATKALHRLFHEAARGVGGTMRLDRPSGEPPLSLIATPYQSASQMSGGYSGALVFVSQPDAVQDAVLLDRLRSLYGLTHAEALVAIRIAHGAGLPVIARSSNLAPSTIRSHAKRVFAKLDVHSQPQLVRIVSDLNLVAGSH
jgi:DNA-binding CsgD family transcriptional regulator